MYTFSNFGWKSVKRWLILFTERSWGIIDGNSWSFMISIKRKEVSELSYREKKADGKISSDRDRFIEKGWGEGLPRKLTLQTKNY